MRTGLLKSWLVFLLLIAIYERIFGNFFPAPDGSVGHDFPLALASLHAGFLWYLNNGALEPPWFTPAFCGGIPFLADPQSGYYSLPQFLSFLVSPLRASHLTLLVSAAGAYWGFHRLLRATFRASPDAAILAGSLFMFNGFLSQRVIVGELGFHGFALVPLIAFLLAGSEPGQEPRGASVPGRGLLAGLLIAYWAQSGLTTLVIPSALAVVSILCLAVLAGRAQWTTTLATAALATLLALGLSASKLTSGWTFFSHFPRTQYALPGVDGAAATLALILRSLFFSSEATTELALPLIRNAQWRVLPHEWAYGISIVPLLILLATLVDRLVAGAGPADVRRRVGQPRWGTAGLLALILFLPAALLYYSPGWNGLLKTVPLINATAWPFRWIIILIPFLVAVAALQFDRLRFAGPGRRAAGFLALLAVLLIQAWLEPREYYRQQERLFGQSLKPDVIESAWASARKSGVPPPITAIGVLRDAEGIIVAPIARNDLVALGQSQLLCYNPIFGYGLEKFPIGSLHPGPALEAVDGVLNVKNPACYVYPRENGCEPGDPFAASDRERAAAFLAYRRWPFEKSRAQRVADRITLTALVVIVLLAGWVTHASCRKTGRRSIPDPRHDR